MRILADENIPSETVEALRSAGHDVAWVGQDSPGASDEAVLDRAAAENRVALTFDKDFGELAFGRGLPVSSGVILLRLRVSDPKALRGLVVAALKDRDDWAGHFSVIENERIRMKPLLAT